MTALYVSVAAVVLGAMLWDFGRRALSARTSDALWQFGQLKAQYVNEITALRTDLDNRDAQWVKAFEGHIDHLEARAVRIEMQMKAHDPGFQPLGKRYDPKLHA